jgi:hypothetical protein
LLPLPTGSGTPSSTNSGSLLLVTDVPPRIRMLMPPPGSLSVMTCTPATFAVMSCSGLTTRPVLNCDESTLATTPVRLRASCVP